MDFLLRESIVPWTWMWLDDGQTAVILDIEDYTWAHQLKWAPKPSKSGPTRKLKIYAYRTAGQGKRGRYSMFLHKVICQLTHGDPPTDRHIIADHCNGHTLDCRRGNLRWATRSENRLNINGAYAKQLRLFK